MNDSSSDRPGTPRLRTRLVQAGRRPQEQFGFVNTPIYHGSTVLYPNAESLEEPLRFVYGTKGTPTTEALETAWSELAGAARTVLAPSGLSALTLALMTATKAGDHVLVSDSAYRPTRIFCDTVLKRFGVATDYYDPAIGAGIEALFTERTAAVLVEAPGSQSFEMQDVPAISEAAHRRGVCVIMDNTWATPIFFPPHERGVDLAVEAGTKYLSGHSDILLGLVSANELWAKRLRATYDAFANCPGAEDVFLGLRGLRTLELRLREAERQGLALARWLESRPDVSRVLHPALPSHPGHALWRRDFLGASGLFSIILRPAPKSAVHAMLNAMRLFGLGYSWGGYESLIIPFDCAPYRTATRWAPEGPALRLQVGLEDIEDLKEDLDRGLAALAAA